MDSKPLAKHEVNFTQKVIEELGEMGKAVSDKLFLHFVKPISNGVIPPHELQGRYKPSWEMPFINSPMREAFMKQSKLYNLHHYHFGYQFYIDANDLKYPGNVSDGIIHTLIICGDEVVSHNILQVCLEHPSPFKQPFERVNDDIAV
jgi:hypothetical protein